MDSSPESSPQRYQDDSNNIQEDASGMEGEVYYVDEYGNPVQLQEGQEYEYADGHEHEGQYEGEYQEGDESGEYEHGHDGHDEDGIDDDEALEEHEEGDIIMEQHSRKIKRDLQENLNKYRKGKELTRLYNDLFSSMIAGDYAEYLKHNEHDPDLFKQLCEEYQIFGDLKVVYTISRFEEDANISETFHQDFLDLGYLLLEVETDRQIILDNHFNHMGIGVSMTAEKMILVETFSQKLLTITKISEGEDGGIEVRGKMLTSERGLYAVRLQSVEAKRELLVGPESIEFDRNTKEFIAFLDTEETVGSSHKIIEFYVRVKPDSIEYKKATKEKINLKHLELAHRVPCTIYPDPRYLAEDEEDRIRKEQETLERMRIEEEKRMKKEEERRERKELRRALRQEIEDRRARGEEIESLASSTQRSDRSFMSKQSFAGRALQAMQSDGAMGENKSIASPDRSVGEQDRSEIESIRKGEDQEDKVVEDDDESKEYAEEDESVSKSPMVTNKDIKDELELAIEEAQRQLKKEEDRNFFLQQLILQLRDKNDLNLEKQNEIPMTEPKYLNTLAHVHQIRLDLKQTQDRYNDMARELQHKLDEKQAKCFEIRKAFMDLKKEVCKKAAFSRTDKPIPDMLIEEWKEREDDKSKELQLLRLENLRLRNHLAKNQKVLKKKEELAEGLHLIDYEQLKIENQTLNEKIEERNEDLHKLKKKNTNTVQILTHFKEKLQFVIQENEKLKKEGEDKESVLIKLRKDLNDLKDSKKDLKIQNQHLRQQTGIMNSKYLSRDFENLKTTLKEQRIDLRFHQEKHKYMLSLVEEFNRRTGKKTR